MSSGRCEVESLETTEDTKEADVSDKSDASVSFFRPQIFITSVSEDIPLICVICVRNRNLSLVIRD